MKRSYRYHERARLRATPGIYRLQKRALMGWRDTYVGQSINVQQRWVTGGKRRHQYLPLWADHQRSMRLVVAYCWRCNLDYREAKAIKKYKPDLNIQRPAPARNWSPLVLAEDIALAPWWVLPPIIGLIFLLK